MKNLVYNIPINFEIDLEVRIFIAVAAIDEMPRISEHVSILCHVSVVRTYIPVVGISKTLVMFLRHTFYLLFFFCVIKHSYYILYCGFTIFVS